MDKLNVPELFGSLVFNDKVMRERLSDDVYDSLKKTIDENVRLDDAVAINVTSQMLGPEREYPVWLKAVI